MAEAASMDVDERESDGIIAVPVDNLKAETKCPVCLGILRQTMTVMECMHRFCQECIHTCLRINNNECPACRTHVPSKRSLRPDPNFDALLVALYGDIDKYEEQEDLFIQEMNKSNQQQYERLLQLQRQQKERNPRGPGPRQTRPSRQGAGPAPHPAIATGPLLVPPPPPPPSVSAGPAVAVALTVTAQAVMEQAAQIYSDSVVADSQRPVSIVLQPHEDCPSLPPLPKPYLSCKPHTTVEHLCKLVAHFHPSVNPQSLQCVFRESSPRVTPSASSDLRLAPTLTVGEVFGEVWSGDGDLLILYRFRE